LFPKSDCETLYLNYRGARVEDLAAILAAFFIDVTGQFSRTNGSEISSRIYKMPCKSSFTQSYLVII
jgi:hypothetical protein